MVDFLNTTEVVPSCRETRQDEESKRMTTTRVFVRNEL